MKIKGRSYKWSLRTDDKAVAVKRMERGRDRIVERLQNGAGLKCSPLVDRGARAQSLIYFAGVGEFIKIGFTRNWPNRLITLQVSFPHEIELLCLIKGDEAKEGLLHQKFDHLRVRGEWFRRDKELVDFISGLDAATGGQP